MTEPPRAPEIRRKLEFPPRRIAAMVVLSAMPLASVLGAFAARERVRAEADGLTIEVGFPARTLYRETETIDIAVSATRGCAELVVAGLEPYLERFERVQTIPSPPDASRTYRGPLAAGERLILQVQARPVSLGRARARLRARCDARLGPEVELSTIVFP
jgi:hypothetical protein